MRSISQKNVSVLYHSLVYNNLLKGAFYSMSVWSAGVCVCVLIVWDGVCVCVLIVWDGVFDLCPHAYLLTPVHRAC